MTLDANQQALSCPSAPVTGAELRKFRRYRVNWPATCDVGGGRPWGLNIQDASEDGFRLSRCEPLAEGDVFTIDIETVGVFRCVLVWKSPASCGVKLLPDEDQVDEALLAALPRQLGLI
jgi:hypothetical protein